MSSVYHGKILEINLSTGSIKETRLDEEYYRKYLGGSGTAAKLFYDRGYSSLDPFQEEAPLIFMSGLLTGVNVPTACKASFCAKSPATGIWAEATVGGRWPNAFKGSGYDGLVISGKAPRPVYLYLDETTVELHDADNLWGRDVYATQELIREEQQNDRVRSASIGPAGENMSLIAGIIIDGAEARAAGRCGMGALMGAKNLKAIAAAPGSKRNLNPFDAEGLSQARKKVLPKVKEKAKGLTDYGTAGGVPVVEKLGDLPIRNWTRGSWTEGANKVSGQAIAESVLVKHYACHSCPIRCGKVVKVTRGKYSGTTAHGPEYETTAGFGSLCLNEDLEYIVAANDLCNRMGLDTISTSAAIAFAMELYEVGLLTTEDTEGMEIKWGDGETILQLVEMIAHRQGIGKLLSQGVKKAAEDLGPMAKEYAVETKGLEYAFHDPRAFTSMAIVYATGSRGACHLEGLTYFSENRAFPPELMGLEPHYDYHSPEGKPLLAKVMQDYMAVFNPLGLCKFLIRGHITPEEISQWLQHATGWELDAAGLMKAGERIFNLKRLINCDLGISRKDDWLPPRLLTHDRGEGAAAGSLPHLGRMLSEYYRLRGWTPEGIPTGEVLDDYSVTH